MTVVCTRCDHTFFFLIYFLYHAKVTRKLPYIINKCLILFFVNLVGTFLKPYNRQPRDLHNTERMKVWKRILSNGVGGHFG